MTVTIRNAVDADLDALIKLNAQVQRLHAQVYPGDFKLLTGEGEVRDFLVSAMRQTAHAILLAQVDGAVVGYAWFEIQDRPQTPFTWPRKRVFLHHICVDAGHRRLGAGSALIIGVEERALAGGIGEVALDMWSLNNTAQAFMSLRRWGSLSKVSVHEFYALRLARIAPLLLLLLAILSALHAAGFRDFVVSSKTGGLGRALVGWRGGAFMACGRRLGLLIEW